MSKERAKYRIWNKEKACWHQILTLAGVSPVNPANGIDAWMLEGVSLEGFRNDNNFVVTKSLGKKDKNGIEIYEEDIIKKDNNEIIGNTFEGLKI